MIRFVRHKRNSAAAPRKARKPTAARHAKAPERSSSAEPPPATTDSRREETVVARAEDAAAEQCVASEETLAREESTPREESAPQEEAPLHEEEPFALKKSSAHEEPVPADEAFAHEEERFFNEAETAEPESLRETLLEEHPFSSLAPTVLETRASPPVESADAAPDVALDVRRKRLRQAVALTLCASAILLLLGVARRPPRNLHAKSAVVLPAARNTTAAPAAFAHVEPATAALPLPSASAPKTADESAARESAVALLASARALLRAGRIRAGVEVARQALAANRRDAEAYILLAAGLQDLGDWSGAQRVFAECKEKAQRGSQAECSYFSSQRH